MKFRELLRLIEDDRRQLVAPRGSHRQFEHPTKPGNAPTAVGVTLVQVPAA